VLLEATSEVAGVQLLVRYDADALCVGEPLLTDRCAGMRVEHHQLPRRLDDPGSLAGTEDGDRNWQEWMMVIFDPFGGSIAAGAGAIVHIPFEKRPASDQDAGVVRIEEVVLADPYGGPVVTTMDGRTTLAGGPVPDVYALAQNYPNPFNPTTVIEYHLPYDGKVELRVYNLAGQCVRRLLDGYEFADYHHVVWDGRDDLGRPVASGIYVYRLRAGGFLGTKKMALLR
jgi:hypothetical protein